MEPPAGERAHAVERQRRRVPVRHHRADMAERHVAEPHRQREDLDPALVRDPPQRSVGLSGGPPPLSQGVPGHEPLDRPDAEQAAACYRRAHEKRAPVKPCLHACLPFPPLLQAVRHIIPAGRPVLTNGPPAGCERHVAARRPGHPEAPAEPYGRIADGRPRAPQPCPRAAARASAPMSHHERRPPLGLCVRGLKQLGDRAAYEDLPRRSESRTSRATRHLDIVQCERELEVARDARISRIVRARSSPRSSRIVLGHGGIEPAPRDRGIESRHARSLAGRRRR